MPFGQTGGGAGMWKTDRQVQQGIQARFGEGDD
jgi:hypothetical protein